MALFDGSPVMEVVSLPDGRFGVRATGGNALGSIVQEFETQNEAENWMISHTRLDTSSAGILKPGGGQGVS